MLPSFELFGREIGLYGVMCLLGILACLFVGSKLIKRFKIDIYDFVFVMFSVFAGLAIGAVLVYGISNIRMIIYAISHIRDLWFKSFWELMLAAFGGMVFYGGFIGGACGLLVFTRFSKSIGDKRDDLFDVYAVLIPLFHTFGRVGCFLGGCCYGIESELGFTVHGNTLNPSINDVNRFPVQLVESACNLIIFGIILYFFLKRIMEKRLIYLYMIIYPIIRFILEFLRGDDYRGFFFGLSTSQWISIFLIVYAVIILSVKTKRIKGEISK